MNELGFPILSLMMAVPMAGALLCLFASAPQARQIALVAKNGHLSGIETAICGEAASDPLLLPFFVGVGIDRLSMSPNLVPTAKRGVRRCRDYACKQLAQSVMMLSTATEVKQALLAYQESCKES